MLIYFRHLAQFAFTCLGNCFFNAEKMCCSEVIPWVWWHCSVFLPCICSKCKWNARTAGLSLFTSFYCHSLSYLLDYMCVNWSYYLHLFNSIDWNNPESPPVRTDLATNHCSSSEIINQPQARSIMWDFSVEEILTAPWKKRYLHIGWDSLLEQQITLK